jgi:hypothetical protein
MEIPLVNLIYLDQRIIKRTSNEVFAGLDGRTINSKTLISFSYQGGGILFGNKMYLQQ